MLTIAEGPEVMAGAAELPEELVHPARKIITVQMIINKKIVLFCIFL